MFASCATTATHQFAEPKNDWQTRTGQLLYRNPKMTVIGDVVVRFSKKGDFELTFSKGPGVTLLNLRQDANFAEVKGPMASRAWSGPIEHVPQRLLGWIELCDYLLYSFSMEQFIGGTPPPPIEHVTGDRIPGQDRLPRSRQVPGAERFVFRF